jgi:RNA 3'-phosphate cyclase
MDLLEVDGSQGEGGGQILRSAVVFSSVQGRPIRVTRVRGGRRDPGLKRQHVRAVEVLARVFGGQVEGASEGSTEVTFVPGKPISGDLVVDTGTAASITLVLQAVVPAVALAHSRLSLELRGGTDVPWSPTFDYFATVARGAYEAIGIRFSASALRRGFYPKGGGVVKAAVEPSTGLKPLDLQSLNTVRSAGVLSRCSRLPRHVAERQLDAAKGVLQRGGVSVGEALAAAEDSDSPGSTILVSHRNGAFLGSDGLGAPGIPAEEVGRRAAQAFLSAAGAGASLDSHVADMVLPLLSLAPGPSVVRVPAVTAHLETGLALARQFTGCSYAFAKAGRGHLVTVAPGGD